jgi:hypothetical protein
MVLFVISVDSASSESPAVEPHFIKPAEFASRFLVTANPGAIHSATAGLLVERCE